MRFKIIKYVGVAAWQWKGVEEGDICGICQNEFEKTCPSCRIPGKDCPLSESSGRFGEGSFAHDATAFGKCSHKYHSVSGWVCISLHQLTPFSTA